MKVKDMAEEAGLLVESSEPVPGQFVKWDAAGFDFCLDRMDGYISMMNGSKVWHLSQEQITALIAGLQKAQEVMK